MPIVQKQLAEVLTVARASAGTVFDAAGNITTVAANLPRFDYDPVTKAFKGLLVEEQRTNLWAKSEGFGVTWSSGGPVFTQGFGMSPMGGLSSLRVQTSAVSGMTFGDLGSTADVVGQMVTHSIFFRSNSFVGSISIYCGQSNSTGGQWFTLSVASAGAVPQLSGGVVTAAGGGWFRLAMSYSPSVANTAPTLVFGSVPAGADFELWGRMREIGAFATSYIPTTTAAVTRAADGVQVVDGLWRGNADHTLFVEASRYAIQPAGTGGATFAALRTAAVSVEGVFIVCSASVPTAQGVQIWSRSVNLLNPAAASAGTVYKLALSTSKTRCAAAIDGVLIGSATFADLPPLTRLFLGGNGSTGSFLNGHIRQVQYTDRVLSDADLIAVSLKGLAA